MVPDQPVSGAVLYTPQEQEAPEGKVLLWLQGWHTYAPSNGGTPLICAGDISCAPSLKTRN